jgi:O-antigen/teichoic acid export membrane protein
MTGSGASLESMWRRKVRAACERRSEDGLQHQYYLPRSMIAAGASEINSRVRKGRRTTLSGNGFRLLPTLRSCHMDRPRGMDRVRAVLRSSATTTTLRGRMVMLLGATAFGQVIALVVSPVLTRLTGPASFGVFGVYLAALGVLGAASSWRSGLAIPLPESDQDAAALVAAGALGSLGLASLAGVAVLLWGGWIAREVLSTPAIEPLLWLVPVGMLGVGLTDVLSGWCVRYQRFQPLARSRVSRSAGTSACQVIIGFLVRGSPVGLVGGDVIGRLYSVAEMARTIARAERGRGSFPSAARIRAVIARYRAFATISTPSTLINAAGAWAPVLLLTLWWGPVAGGLYTIGQRVIGVPIGLLGDSAGQVYISELAARSRGPRSTMTRLFARTARGLLLLGVPAGLAMLLLAPPAFRLVFGSQWTDAGVMVQWQSVALVCQLVAIPLAQTLNVLGHQREQFAWDLLRLGLTVLGFWWAHHAGLNAVGSIAVYGGVTTVTYLALIALGWRAVRARSAVIDQAADAVAG